MPYSAPTHKPNPGRAQAQHDAERGSASSRGYGAEWRRIRAAFLKRNPLCVECLAIGRTAPATDVDHIVPRRRGGSDRSSNLQALCHSHHSQKTAAERGGTR